MQIDWLKESRGQEKGSTGDGAQLLATGRKVAVTDKRYRVYRPHNSALSVLIIRRAKKKDSGIFRCNLSGSSTKHKYLVLNVTGVHAAVKNCNSKICLLHYRSL